MKTIYVVVLAVLVVFSVHAENKKQGVIDALYRESKQRTSSSVNLMLSDGELKKYFNIHGYYEEIGVPKEMYIKLDACRIIKDQFIFLKGKNWEEGISQECEEVLALYKERSSKDSKMFDMEHILGAFRKIAREINEYTLNQDMGCAHDYVNTNKE